MNKSNLTKNEIVKNLSLRTGYSISISKKLINDLIDNLKKLIVNNNLNLKNIGTFKLIHKNERIGRNPKTKKEFIISQRKTISFTASKKLLNLLNKNK